MKKPILYLGLVLGLCATHAVTAHADQLGSRRYQSGAITRINKGVKQLALESTWVLTFDQQGDASAFRTNTVIGAAFRYFLKDNLGLSLRGGFSYRKAGDSADKGFLGAMWANYYVRLGEGMFFSPGVGAGFVNSGRETPVGGGILEHSDVVAGVAGVEFMLAVYIGPRFHLLAGPEFLYSIGKATPSQGGEGSGFSSLDGTLKIGMGYSF